MTNKQSYRRKVWHDLERNQLVNFPRPIYGRIPNFKGCEEAACKLATLKEFMSARNVKVNPDKPQEPARFSVLENGKNLYVPIPRLSEGLLNHILLPDNPIKDDIRRAVSRKGLEESGKDIGISDHVKIDLVIVGSVAVSKEGYRIGKGRGYADLEFAILSHMKAVNENTVVVTTVHDNQVFDAIPPELFKEYDVPVDIIVTPSQIYHVKKRQSKPVGIIWNLISPRRLEAMPVLQALKSLDEKNGITVELKTERSDGDRCGDEVRPRNPYLWYYRYGRERGGWRGGRPRFEGARTSESQPEGPDGQEQPPHNPNRPLRRRATDVQNRRRPAYRNRRLSDRDRGEEAMGREYESEPAFRPTPQFVRRPRYYRRETDRSQSECNTDGENGGSGPRGPPRRSFRKNRQPIDFSLMVRNIERNVRVRDLKAALAERGIKPNIITWRGFNGYCCLHFAKNANVEKPQDGSSPEHNATGDSQPGGGAPLHSAAGSIDNVIGMLQNIRVCPDSKKQLSVEVMARPVSRI